MEMEKIHSAPEVIEYYFPTGTTLLGAWCCGAKRMSKPECTLEGATGRYFLRYLYRTTGKGRNSNTALFFPHCNLRGQVRPVG